VNVNFVHLERAEQELRDAIRRVAYSAGRDLFPLDFLAWPAANRSLALLHGFRHLINARNYSTAAALVRLQIDTGLRFKAAWHVENPNALATYVLDGGRLDHYRDTDGKRLTDRHLVS
jgi:hypothetical protein